MDNLPVSPQVAAGVTASVLVIVYVVIALIVVVAWWKIFSKAGHAGALSLLLFIPLVNVIMFLWFAFSDWPVLKEVRRLRESGRKDF